MPQCVVYQAPHNIFRGKRAVTVVFGKTAL